MYGAKDKYYEILGVNNGASVFEMKRAYKIRCKELHPDINQSENAHEKFILLQEAYQNLINTNKNQDIPTEKPDIEKWYKQRQEEQRHQASKYANMSFEDFIQTDYYQKNVAKTTLLDISKFIAAIIILLSPFVGFLFSGKSGFLIGLLIISIMAPFWSITIHKNISNDFKQLFKSVKTMIKNKRVIKNIFLLILLLIVLVFLITQFNRYVLQ
jgi:hypothetical protein